MNKTTNTILPKYSEIDYKKWLAGICIFSIEDKLDNRHIDHTITEEEYNYIGDLFSNIKATRMSEIHEQNIQWFINKATAFGSLSAAIYLHKQTKGEQTCSTKSNKGL